jgi:anaerobic magnesium-protoporphyrin IX monomethyl ester cyclase
MKVCLINPQRLMKLMSATMKPAIPLGLSFIAASLKNAGHTVSIVDCIAEGPDDYYSFGNDIISNGLSFSESVKHIPADVDVIGFSLMFSGNWIHNRKLIDYVGKAFPKAILIAGGEHITACPEFCIEQTKYLTACVLGEGEETVVELLSIIESEGDISTVEGIVYRDCQDKIIATSRRKRLRELDSIPRPAWELFPIEKYRDNGIVYGVDRGIISLPIMATRGCPYTCTFCSSPKMWGTRYFMRTVEDVVDEIETFHHRFGAKNFDFYDLTAIIRKEWIVAFCKELVTRKIDITWQIPAGTRSEAIDTEVSSWLYKSGCRNITYAPESGSVETLKLIKKKINLHDMLRSIKSSCKEGMNIKINFMIGFPNETHRNIWESIYFLLKASRAGVHDMSPAIFSPYPGSELFEQLKEQGKINMLNDDYFLEILNADTFFQNHFYNSNLSKYTLRIYVFIYLFAFYFSNFLLHPKRLIKTIQNIINKKYESRGEMALGELIKRSKITVQKEVSLI